MSQVKMPGQPTAVSELWRDGGVRAKEQAVRSGGIALDHAESKGAPGACVPEREDRVVKEQCAAMPLPAPGFDQLLSSRGGPQRLSQRKSARWMALRMP